VIDATLPRRVPGVAWSMSESPTCSSVVKSVPVPVTAVFPFVNETVPVLYCIQVDALFQFAEPVTRFVT
jgi:hypothetical protein